MDELSLYIAVPGRKNGKAAVERLTGILRKTESDAVLRLTWIMEGPQAGYCGIRRVMKCLKRMEKESGNRVLINTMEFRAWRKSAGLLLRVFSRYRFRISCRLESQDGKDRTVKLQKKTAKRRISFAYDDGNASEEGWISWLSSPEYRPVVFCLDYLKILTGNEPLSCRYRSCLGQTLAVDVEGRWGICPYRINTVQIQDPAECETLEEVFQTDEFLALLKKQVAARERCAAECRYYAGCKGGCPLSPEVPCAEPELLRALNRTADSTLSDSHPAVREERLQQLAGRFSV